MRELARRQWKPVLSGPFIEVAPLDPIVPDPGRHVRDAGQLCRAQGALLGQFAGDSLGSLVEFQDPGAIAMQYRNGPRLLEDGGTFNTIAGQPTDDSEMALMLARSIAREGTWREEAVAAAYAHWIASNPFDRGLTTMRALSPITEVDIAAGTAAEKARARADANSQANGSLMRVSPLGVFGYALPVDNLVRLARADATLTHPHPVCQDASAVMAIAIGEAIRTGSPAQRIYDRALQWAREHAHPDVVETLVASAQSKPQSYLVHQGWVRIALQNAFYRLLHAPDLETGVVDTVREGGDTDTNAAIAGALLGAVHGRDAVPAQWRHLVLTCRPADGLSGVHRPRPRAFWPVDLMDLAERLLYLGPQA